MFIGRTEKVENPLYQIIKHSQVYEPDLIDDELDLLMRNLYTHFHKLLKQVVHIGSLQKDEEYLKKYCKEITGIASVEYCYYKISTIWDISYQIADKIIFLKKNQSKAQNKYEALEQEFDTYVGQYPHLQLDWYRNLNQIRNKIVHGGIKIHSFYIDKNHPVEQRFCFQVYNNDLEDLVVPSYYYSNIYNEHINYTDYYFIFHIHMLYNYLVDFFNFVLQKKKSTFKCELSDSRIEENLRALEVHEEILGITSKYWHFVGTEFDDFITMTEKMEKMHHAQGHILA